MPRRVSSLSAPGSAVRAALGATLLLLVCIASCNDPQAPPAGQSPGESEFRGAYDHGRGGLEFQLEAPGGTISPLRLVATDLTFDATDQLLHAQVAIRNTGDETLPGPAGVLVGDFDPNTVAPSNAVPLPCPACIPCPCPFPWTFDHQGTYGEDGSLAPGETSTPVEWILHDPSGESFAFRARLQGEKGPRAGTISGSVFVDQNADGVRQPREPGIHGAEVSLVHGDSVAVASTDGGGRFAFSLLEAGLYEVVREPAGDCLPTTRNRLQVFIVQRPDGTLSGYDRADFGCRGQAPRDSLLFVAGVVYEDLNRDGEHQVGEPGVAGVLLTGSTGCPTFAAIQTRTDEHGLYRLQLPLCAPPYVVGHEPLAGYVDTSPNPIVFYGMVVPTDPTTVPYQVLRGDFGVARSDSTAEAFVEGFVFRDANRNGVRDPAEPGVADVGVNVSSLLCMIPVIGTTRTDAEGHYFLGQSNAHCPPPWRVGHDPVAETCDTSPNPVIVPPDEPVPHAEDPPLPVGFHVDFGVAACDTLPPPTDRYAIEGVVWLDSDRDGERDAGEPGVADAEVQLLSFCAVMRATRTNARGFYRFEPDVVGFCPVGAVQQTAPEFPVHTTPNPVLVPPNTIPGPRFVVNFGVLMTRPTR